MNYLNGMHQESPRDNAIWNRQESGTRLDPFSFNYAKDVGSNEKSKDISCIYNEFLKNTLDFSETPASYANKLDDDIFFSGTRPRKDFDLIKTKISRKLVDFFRSDQEIESGFSNENKPANLLENLDNFEANITCAISSRTYINDSFNQNDLAIENQQPYQLPQAEITNSESPLASARDQETSGPSHEKIVSKIQSESSPMIKSSGENFQQAIMVKDNKPKKDLENQHSTQESNNSRPKVIVASSLAQAAKIKEPNSYLKININLAHPFITKRKSNYNENLSTKTPSQSSLQSPGTTNKWAEVSLALHKSVSKDDVELNERSQKTIKKKKLKTSSEKRKNKSQSKKQTRVEENATLSPPPKGIHQEDNLRKKRTKNKVTDTDVKMHETQSIPRDEIENHSQMTINRKNSDKSHNSHTMITDPLNPSNIVSKLPLDQANHPDMVPEINRSRNNPNMVYQQNILNSLDDFAGLHASNNNFNHDRIVLDDINSQANDNQANKLNAERGLYQNNPSQSFVPSNLHSAPTQQDYLQSQNHTLKSQSSSQQQILTHLNHLGLRQQIQDQMFPSQHLNYTQQMAPQSTPSRHPLMQQQYQTSAIQYRDPAKFPAASFSQSHISTEHFDPSSASSNQQGSINSNRIENKNYIPPQKNPSMQPRMSPESVFAVLSQHNTQDLLGNLNIPPEIAEEIRKSNIIGKIQNAFQRKIGALSIEERRIKVEKYLQKRKQRSYDKKVNYQSRKQVADHRVRIKGRFVNQDSADLMSKEDIETDELNNHHVDEPTRLKTNNSSSPHLNDVEDLPDNTELAYEDNVINPLFQEEYDRLKFLGFN